MNIVYSLQARVRENKQKTIGITIKQNSLFEFIIRKIINEKINISDNNNRETDNLFEEYRFNYNLL